jgi:hypothetical protein
MLIINTPLKVRCSPRYERATGQGIEVVVGAGDLEGVAQRDGVGAGLLLDDQHLGPLAGGRDGDGGAGAAVGGRASKRATKARAKSSG